MLLKVKPDGPVYEVNFLCQMISSESEKDVASTAAPQSRLETANMRTALSGGHTAASSICPVVGCRSEVDMGAALTTALIAHSGRTARTGAGSLQQSRTCVSAYHQREPSLNDGLDRGAGVPAVNSVTNVPSCATPSSPLAANGLTALSDSAYFQ